MYCRNCGKEIGEDSFCKFCGEPTQAGAARKDKINFMEHFESVREKIRVFGHDRLIHILSWLAAAVGVINRFMHNEIETVYVALAQDDYYVLAAESSGFAQTIIWIQVVICGLLCADVWSRKIWISKGAYVSFVVTLLIQLGALLLRIPAA